MAGGPSPRGFSAELPDQGDPGIGRELIRVRHSDGRTEELRLHDYERLYSLPGLYEEIVHRRLGCRSPQVIAGLLASAADRLGWDRDALKVIDVAAGNGVSGEALVAEGLTPVLGTDIVASARGAALRDRPGLYADYLTLDLLRASEAQRRAIGELAANVLCCVAPVGGAPGEVPTDVLTAAAGLLAPDALVAHMRDPAVGAADPVTPRLWAQSGSAATELERRRYVHRYTVTGAPYMMEAVVWRVKRAAG